MAPLPPPPPQNVRRSKRASLPNTYLLYRRQIIRENFCKTAVQISKKKLNGKLSAIKSESSTKIQNKSNGKSNNKKKRSADRQTKQTKVLNGNGCNSSSGTDNLADAQRLPQPAFDDGLTGIKEEKLDDTTEETIIPKSFVVTKEAAILSPMQGGIHPTYYPSEEDNSGVIIFKKHSPRLKLNISFAKCFVILNGKFCINLASSDKGEFQNGDFIKAPAELGFCQVCHCFCSTKTAVVHKSNEYLCDLQSQWLKAMGSLWETKTITCQRTIPMETNQFHWEIPMFKTWH